MPKRILSPKNDFVFKLIFGDRRNTDILAEFLKAALKLPTEEYDHLVIGDPHLKREFEDDKMGILDVKVHTKNGIVINVEIQVVSSPELRDRIIVYVAKMLTEQVKRGDTWDIKLYWGLMFWNCPSCPKRPMGIRCGTGAVF
jgi:predicted transposase/invertase (TIGR01784 family)